MGNWATFNVNQGDISCWTCHHFQRYDDGSYYPSLCEGECRLQPPEYNAADIVHLCAPPGPYEYFRESYFTFIPFGNSSWCSRYKRSLEVNIPAPPASHWDCPHQATEDFTTPYDIRPVPGPFNKKTVEQSCWYCVHFQRFNEAETMENWACHGYCQIKPPQAYTRETPNWLVPSGCLQNFFIFPYVRFAPRVWCSRWARNPDADQLPAPPEQNGVLCADIP